ncbi:MAG: insulinase family protein [SAR324 cluster bacterium]|nr:insulinase family protein [SAR324 cluster bacterium]
MERLQSLTFMGAYPLNHYRMDNGLEALLLHNPISPVAAYLTHYSVGSASEGDGERGLAHFFEHMMFRETATLKDGDFDRIMAEVGGVGLNAFTSYDTTAYHINVPAANLERVIALEADRMVNLRLSSKLIEIERGAVLGEMNMYKDMPSEQLWNTLTAEAFAAHPYRHPVIGYTDQVRAFTDEDFRRFYQAHYAPNRAVVVVAGGFDEAALLEELERVYGALEPGAPRPTALPPDAPWAESRRVEIRHEKTSTEYLMLAWRAPGLTHAHLPALVLLCAVLAAGHSSPLHRAIVLAGLGTQAGAFTMDAEMMLASPALLLIDVALQHGVASERAEAAVERVLSELRREGIAPEAIERARNQVRLSAYSGLRTNMSLARQVGGCAVACGDPCFGEKLLDALGRVSRDDMMAALEQYVSGAPRLTVIQRPGNGVGA